MSRKVKKSKAVPVVLIITLLVAALAVGCFLVPSLYTDPIRDSRKAEKSQALEDRDALISEIRDQNAAAVKAWEDEKDRLLNPPEQEPVKPVWPQQKTEGWDILDLTDYPLENTTMKQHTRAELMNNGMLLVNEWHSRPEDFSEAELKSVGKYLGGNEKVQVDNYNITLFPVASDALLEAVNAAKAAGMEHYIVTEGYRSWDTQNEMFQKKKEKLASKYTSEEDLINAAKKEVNFPGTSEFNSGLAFTLRLYDKNNSEVGSAKYSTTEQAVWMNENCWKYGLIFRFPLAAWPLPSTRDKSFITGVSVQLNLYRYVGKGNAAFMHYLDMCLEEYIEYLHAHPHLALFEDGVLKYEVYCQYVGNDDSFYILENSRQHVSSLDNMGYVVTVYEP